MFAAGIVKEYYYYYYNTSRTAVDLWMNTPYI